MDVFEFVASLVRSLAWPVALVVVAIVYRRPIRKVLNRIATRVGAMTEVRAWKVRAKFAEKATQVNQEIADEASSIDPPIEHDDQTTGGFHDESPREIVMIAWVDFEQDLRRAAGLAQIPIDPRRGPAWELRPYIPADIWKQMHELIELRNQAAHERPFSVSRESAIEYARAAAKLGAIMRHPSIVGAMRDAFMSSHRGHEE